MVNKPFADFEQPTNKTLKTEKQTASCVQATNFTVWVPYDCMKQTIPIYVNFLFLFLIMPTNIYTKYHKIHIMKALGH